MNMNDREWNEFWDNEPEEEEDDYNDIGSDIDANNDETFDNAAEWNEDEHEELIARDSILSHKTSRPSNHSSNYNNNNNNNHQHHHSNVNHITNSGNSSNNNVFPPTGTRQVLTVDELEQQLLRARISSQNSTTSKVPSMEPSHHSIINNELYKRSGWSPFGGKDLFAGSSSPAPQIPLASLSHNLIIGNQLPQSLTIEQQQQLLLHQHHLLQQQQQQLQRQQQLQQMALKQAQIEHEQKLMSQNAQCFTVEELERQMFAAARSSNPKTEDKKPEPEHHFCFLAREALDSGSREIDAVMDKQKRKSQTNANENRNKRDCEKHDRNDRVERELKETRDSRRDNRDQREPRNYRDRKRENHRDHHRENDQKDSRDSHHYHNQHGRNHNRRTITIIPPQVQLKVIDKAKRLHSITTMHPDEFLQDRLPTSEHGFLFKRHSNISDHKGNHDGILTEKERNWLTKIQEKIQADYDDNLDQDYYYLLYFNRSSITNEATQKPCGPGVLDRRFIPRERLLYNTST